MRALSSVCFEMADSLLEFFDFILNGSEAIADSALQQHCERDDEPDAELRECKLLDHAPSGGYAVLQHRDSEEEQVQDDERDEDHLRGPGEKECER